MSGWAVLTSDEGEPFVIRKCDVVAVAYHRTPGVVSIATQIADDRLVYYARVEPGESPGDALARVCGLLGIEVGR